MLSNFCPLGGNVTPAENALETSHQLIFWAFTHIPSANETVLIPFYRWVSQGREVTGMAEDGNG